MKRFQTLALLAIFGLSLLGSLVPAQPAAAAPVTQFAACGEGSFFGFSPWYACLPGGDTGEPRIEELDDLFSIGLVVIEWMIKAMAYIAVAFIIWGGVKYSQSQAEPGKLQDAKDTIKNAIIGLVICMLSVGIVEFVSGAFK